MVLVPDPPTKLSNPLPLRSLIVKFEPPAVTKPLPPVITTVSLMPVPAPTTFKTEPVTLLLTKRSSPPLTVIDVNPPFPALNPPNVRPPPSSKMLKIPTLPFTIAPAPLMDRFVAPLLAPTKAPDPLIVATTLPNSLPPFSDSSLPDIKAVTPPALPNTCEPTPLWVTARAPVKPPTLSAVPSSTTDAAPIPVNTAIFDPVSVTTPLES